MLYSAMAQNVIGIKNKRVKPFPGTGAPGTRHGAGVSRSEMEKFHDFNKTINTWKTKFYSPIVVSDLCPLPSTSDPPALIPFFFQTSPFIIRPALAAPLHNATSIKRVQHCVSTSYGGGGKIYDARWRVCL